MGLLNFKSEDGSEGNQQWWGCLAHVASGCSEHRDVLQRAGHLPPHRPSKLVHSLGSPASKCANSHSPPVHAGPCCCRVYAQYWCQRTMDGPPGDVGDGYGFDWEGPLFIAHNYVSHRSQWSQKPGSCHSQLRSGSAPVCGGARL